MGQGGDFREQREMEEEEEEDEEEEVETVLSCRLSQRRLFLPGYMQVSKKEPAWTCGQLGHCSDLWFGLLWRLWLRLLLGRELSVDLILFTCLQDCSTAVPGTLRADLICQRKKNQQLTTL